MHKRTPMKIGACVLAAFHMLVVVLPNAVPSSSCGGGQAGLLVALFDWPLVALVEALPHSGAVFYDALTKYELFFWFGGTLMYAGVGALVGRVFDAIRRAHRQA